MNFHQGMQLTQSGLGYRESKNNAEVAEHLCTTTVESDKQLKEQLPCEWTDKEIWGQPTTDESSNNKSLLQVAEEHAHQIFAGKSVLVIGGSTSRDLAADFMHAVLPLELRHNVSLAWNASSVQGYELFPPIGKHETDFDRMYKKEVMFPLMNAGWNFTNLLEKSSGCRDCSSSYVNIDYFAELFGGNTRSASGITYEFSWKPDIFAPEADTDGFTHRFCPPNRRYDIVFIGRGLHDAAFKSDKLIEHSAVDTRFRRLAGLLKCFPETTLIILRTPYVTRSEKEQERLLNITESMINLARNGTFGLNRTLLIDGHLLTASTAHPESFDGHHYDSRVAQSVWRLIFFASAQFFVGVKLDGLSRANSFKESLGLHWQECGITAW